MAHTSEPDVTGHSANSAIGSGANGVHEQGANGVNGQGPSGEAGGSAGDPGEPDGVPGGSTSEPAPGNEPAGRSAGGTGSSRWSGALPGAPVPMSDATDQPATASRAGRDLVAAIVVGVLLGGLIVGSVIVYRPAFIVLLTLAVVGSVWELIRAVEYGGISAPFIPLLVGSVAIQVMAWLRGTDGLVVAFLLTVLGCLVWRLADTPTGYLRDASVGVLVAAYVPFLAGFAVMLAVPEDGAARVIAFIGAVVCSDVGGYAAGVLFGKHPMAATISPKKSWEGLAGSALTCVVFGILVFALWLGAAWWQGAIFGLVIAGTATLGDLGESMIKRDLGIKDMGRLLPGHGGLMDRMDSLLPSAAASWLLLSWFVPIH